MSFLITNRFLDESQALFTKLCFELGGIPARLEIREEKGTTAYWKQMLVVINSEYVEIGGKPFTEDVIYHELGHAHGTWQAPARMIHI